jgi:hypothetical protein
MSAVKRRVFNLLAAMSLVLCVATVVMWVRSHWRTDLFVWGRTNGYSQVISMSGTVRFSNVFDAGYRSGWYHTAYRSDPARTPGFILLHRKGGGVVRAWDEWTVAFPWSVACLAFVTAPAVWLLWFRHTRIRDVPGRCRNCGYDLRATPDRCPECGTAASESAV